MDHLLGTYWRIIRLLMGVRIKVRVGIKVRASVRHIGSNCM